MPLSRLENFLKNAEGNILYVNPSDFDATDSIENRGNSLTRPFRTIQRAVIEASRFSYLVGRNNDKIDSTTILVYPGTHYIDNRPGHSITNQNGTAEFKRYLNGSWTTSGATLTEFTQNSNFDIFDEDNDLYKYNSVNGGVILPRGTSIVGLDLRKTKIRPMYIPDPLNDAVATSAIFRVTGTCYFTAFTIFDADPQRACYKDSTIRKVAPNFSHHKLTAFEYADGINKVTLGTEVTTLTDLEMYYYKVTYAYGDTSGRGIPNYPVNNVSDFEPSVDEYRIVGDLRADPIGISSIKAGNGVVPTTTITVTTTTPHGLFKDTPVLISGVTTSVTEYNGSFLVSDVPSTTQFTYIAPSTPVIALPNSTQILNARTIVESDSVSSASPYVFSCTLRSVYGMNGLHADGSKATGFKSMLTAQFTGISLQKDDNAFILYDEATGIYNDNLTASDSQKPLHTNSRAIYKPGWENIHMRCSNNAIIQCVSIFAIGYAKHFVAETGGDQSITNSNSNFGAISLEANGFRPESFDRDDVGYITHVIPPRELVYRESNVTWLPLDAQKIISAATTSKLWIAFYESKTVAPPSQIDSYRIGAKKGEELYLSVIIGAQQSNFKAPILMTQPSGIGTSSEKVFSVGRASGINSITSNIFTLTANHTFFNGEKVRVLSDNGNLPENISDKVYYVTTTGLSANQVKLSSTLNDANTGNTITGISNQGGRLDIVSYVSDKVPGDAGHPIQYDDTFKQWYIQSTPVTIHNTIYDGIVGIGTSVLGNQTGSTFITRRVDNRGLDDRIYKLRYVIPKEFVNARPPTDGFVLQESKKTGITSVSLLTSALTDPTQLRNPKIIKTITYSSGSAFVKTELSHNLVVGDKVKIANVVSSIDTAQPYNGSFTVQSVITPREFSISGFSSSPGVFLNKVNERSTQQQIEALPTVQKEKAKESIFIYRSQEVKKLIPGAGGQDGIYNIICLSGSIKPDSSVGFGLSSRNFNQDVKNLYPQGDRDNYNSDPLPTLSYAELSPSGVVRTSSKRDSLTKEALNYFFGNQRVGFAVTGATITGTGNTTITIFTDIDHNLNSVKSVTLLNPGSGYNNNAGVTSTIYVTELLNNSLPGKNATAKVTISIGNTISSVEIIEGGGAYAVGNTMSITGELPAAAPSSYAFVQVASINNNIGDSLELNGFAEPTMNGTFKIVDIPSSKSISVLVDGGLPISNPKTRNDNRTPIAYHSAKSVGITTITLNKAAGIATAFCNEGHGLVAGNTFNLVGTGNTFLSKKFIVNESLGITSFSFYTGVTTATQTWNLTGVTVQKSTISANGKALGLGEENLGGRGSFIYAGITTTLSNAITSTDTTIVFTSSNGFRKGDYVSINSEIIRLADNPTGNTFTVLRGQFSTVASASDSGSVVRKVRVLPMEIRRPSILRASGHTFEYLGYGPGNYSTGLPVKQDRILSSEEVLVSQAREQDGGTVVYTGMNDRGEFYSGATKINGATGEEETIDAPVVSYFGDEEATVEKRNSGVFDDLVVKERITVEGGENNNQTSQFYGPVNFSQKVTSTSDSGLETRDLYIKGLASQPKLITVGISTPTDTKKAGDISLIATPDPAGYIGHVYVDGDWRRWGMISQDKNRDFLKLDQIGVGDSTGIYNFTDALEVNGTVKVKNLYVGGAVTFAGAQAIGSAAFDTVDLNKTITFKGIGTNYTILTTDATDIAQFQNLEVTGYAATFTTAKVTFGESFNSTYVGVSTVAGTLVVNNLIANTGVITAANMIVNNLNAGRLSVSTEAYISSGIITAIRTKYIGGLGNLGVGETVGQIMLNVGIITSLTGTACTITTINGTNAFIAGVRANTALATPLATINTGIITNFNASVGMITSLYSSVGVVTTLIVPSGGWMGAPTAYVNSGIITTITSTLIGGASAAAPLTACINVGIVTSLTGAGATYTNAQITNALVANGTGTGQGVYANVGVISAFGPGAATPTAGNMNINCGASGDITARILTSTVAQGTAPITVTSTTICSNLNVGYLSGRATAGYLRGINDVWQSSDEGTNRLYFANAGRSYYKSANGHEFRKNNDTAIFTIDDTGNATAAGEVTANSDERLKTNIKTIENALDKVTQLRGVEYDRTDIEKHQIGVIAQEVEKVVPEVVHTNEDGMKSVAYGNIVAVLIESIKELKGEISELRAELNELKGTK